MQIAEIAGRVAGPAQQCVTLRPNESVRTTDSDRHVLLYGSGRTIWVNHLGSCSFGSNDALLIERTGSDLCRGEIIRSFDPIQHNPRAELHPGRFHSLYPLTLVHIAAKHFGAAMRRAFISRPHALGGDGSTRSR